jgi:AraC-like DNA-binding protein
LDAKLLAADANVCWTHCVTGLDFHIPALVPAGLVAYACTRGVEVAQVLAAMDVTPELLADPERMVSARVMMPLWRFLNTRFPNEAVALDVAHKADVSLLGLSGQLIRHSPTLRAATERVLRYHRLLDPGLCSTAVERDGRVILTFSHVEEVERLGTPLEFMAAFGVQCLRQLAQRHIPVRETWLVTQPSGPLQAYHAFFGGPVRFGQDSTRVMLDAADLDSPVPNADPHVLRYLTAFADQQLSRREQRPVDLPLAMRVRRALEQGLVEGNVGPDAVARRLAMSTRTLQRRLAAGGESFQALCDDVRKQAALRLLEDPSINLHEVGFLVGYSDNAAFYRAFKRWTGHTPAEQRRTLLG